MSKKDKFFGDLGEVTTEAPVVVEEVVETELPAVIEEPIQEDITVNAADECLTHTSLGMYTDARGRFQIAKIKFDPLTGTTGSIDTSLEAAMDKMTAEETFKLTVVRENIFSN